MSSARSSSSSSSSSCVNSSVDVTTSLRYCTLHFYGVKKQVAWPVDSRDSSNDIFLRLVADACEISHESIKYITLREVGKKNGGNGSDNQSVPHETRAFRATDSDSAAISIDSILAGRHKACSVCFDDSSILSDSSSVGTSRGLRRFKPYASEIFYLLGRRGASRSSVRGTPRSAGGSSIYNSFATMFGSKPTSSSNNDYSRRDDYSHVGEDVDEESNLISKKSGARFNRVNADSNRYDKDKKNRFYDFTEEETDDNEGIADRAQAVGAFDEDFSGSANREQLIKFKRILSHLVNERTVLAWLRLCMAFISLSFKFKTLAFDYYEDAGYSLSTFLYLVGGFYVLMLPFTW